MSIKEGEVENNSGEGELRRVLFELSLTNDGSIEVRVDHKMKPLMLLAVISSLDTLKDELKELVVWGDDE